ncbi:NADH-quinone oxidoreductase subunit A [Aureibacter tunicatorum]|uniref:NADH-quinone oxidoreductase subunit A n=1 Tax=Aureibacter tunicatorum TaxID=866807 RepID=A0AAE3XJR9_9BACT|nr:NADH-quinone oxidoreductase subunit A [Aureibacter tunicatorum]MDR6237682.1 NADH-quinone oxidoreductase subunit A [Aureibacter tunicatorum]BDD02717.1 NADH-quinone oxidoreductase subunit A [Aureibacter tunicatorum]
MEQISTFGEILLYIIGSIVFALGGLFTAFMLRPNRPNEEKLTTYECGEDPVQGAWGKFNMRFYIVAILFILFDVEIVFIFPWAVVFGREELITETNGLWAWFSIAEMFTFIFILILGLAYAWAKGFLEWEKPDISLPETNSPVPQQLYENLNKKYSKSA